MQLRDDNTQQQCGISTKQLTEMKTQETGVSHQYMTARMHAIQDDVYQSGNLYLKAELNAQSVMCYVPIMPGCGLRGPPGGPRGPCGLNSPSIRLGGGSRSSSYSKSSSGPTGRPVADTDQTEQRSVSGQLGTPTGY